MCHLTQPMITPTKSEWSLVDVSSYTRLPMITQSQLSLSGHWLMCHLTQPMITPTKSEWSLVDVSSYTTNDYTN